VKTDLPPPRFLSVEPDAAGFLQSTLTARFYGTLNGQCDWSSSLAQGGIEEIAPLLAVVTLSRKSP
jgi:hypothetical protein